MRQCKRDIKTAFPTFPRLLHQRSCFRRVIGVVLRCIFCGLAALVSMTVLTDVAMALLWRAWKTFEFITPSQSLVIPFSLLVSSGIGSVFGAHLRLSRFMRTVGTVAGLLLFSYVGSAVWVSWFIPESFLDLFDGWFNFSFAQEYMIEVVFGESPFVPVALWLLLGLWAGVGLVVGIVSRVPDRFRAARVFGGIIGTLIVANLLLASIFYPLAVAERREAEYTSERFAEIHRAYSKLKKSTESSGPANARN